MTRHIKEEEQSKEAELVRLRTPPLLQCDEIADHFTCVSNHASASSNEKEYSWSRTPERILPPSARFMM